MRAVVLIGSFILMMTAANLFGLYSAFLHFKAMSFNGSSKSSSAVETRFCRIGDWSFGSC